MFMKRAISLVMLIACLFLFYQVGVTFLKKSHEVDYTMKNSGYTFQIHEQFKNKNYYFEITSGQYKFYTSHSDAFTKTKEVIKDIEVKEENNLLCIYPVYKEDTPSAIVCSDGKTNYSKETAKNYSAYQTLLAFVKEKGFEKDEIYQETEKLDGRITYYPSAIEDEIITVWTYQGIVIVGENRSDHIDTISFDRYDNTQSELVGKYYVTPIYQDNRLYEYSSLYCTDVTNNTQETIALPIVVSNYSYVNGVVDGKLYLFDKNAKKQIEIDPKKGTARIIGSEEDDGIYYNGDWSSRNIYDFVQQELYFSDFDESILKSKYSYNSAWQSEDSYYFYDGGNMYQVYKDALDTPILLFQQNGIVEVHVEKDTLYYIVGDTLYRYSPYSSTKRVLKYAELPYNYKNMIDIYKK